MLFLVSWRIQGLDKLFSGQVFLHEIYRDLLLANLIEESIHTSHEGLKRCGAVPDLILRRATCARRGVSLVCRCLLIATLAV